VIDDLPLQLPRQFRDRFEDAFDSESDSGNRLDFPGPDQLANGLMDVFPHRGAYCMRVNLARPRPAYARRPSTARWRRCVSSSV
jgi:hypothetical protein